MSPIRGPPCKEMMQAFLIKLKLVVIEVAKAGPQIKGQPSDLILLKTHHVQHFQDEVGAVLWKDVPWS